MSLWAKRTVSGEARCGVCVDPPARAGPVDRAAGAGERVCGAEGGRLGLRAGAFLVVVVRVFGFTLGSAMGVPSLPTTLC
ncbi:MAG: hypothetical protein HY319_30645 [Armatimonadetes bacterium]|nr:hypothetical protein [Armatimonadota bacterium]